MERQTFDATIAAYVNREPFVPFTVTLLHGGRIEVDHARAVNHRNGTAVYIAPAGVPHIFDYHGVMRIVGDIADSPAD
jgi:hypothetical protein